MGDKKDAMDIGLFIKKCFEIGISLLNKEKLTEEEKELLNALDSFEKWIQGADLCSKCSINSKQLK